ncbi:MAG: hypothetical protein PS018_00570 [bacterium]|nr:hypothetical protein [bacterium]
MAKSNKGTTLWACATAQNTDLDQAAFTALTWVQVNQVGSIGETGPNTNMLTYDTLDTTVSQKDKGITNAGDPAIEVARVPTDPGQILLRAQGAPTNYDAFAFKMVKRDGTIMYNRGKVTGPLRPNGRNEDFDLETYTLGLEQLEIVVNP